MSENFYPLTIASPTRQPLEAMAKVYSPQVFQALAESLRLIYWFADDLRSFLVRAGIGRDHVARLDWKYKRTAIRELLDDLAAQGGAGTSIVENLVSGVVEQDERFRHLAKLDDGKAKVREAQAAVRALKELLGHQTVVAHAKAARAENRTEAERRRAEKQQRAHSLADLKQRFKELTASSDHIRRGLDLQPWLRAFFALHDLEPRGSFASVGEQIDGSIRVDGQTLLVEARWTKELVGPDGVRDFVGKFERKLDNTLGLIVSIEGFTSAAATKATSAGRLLTIFLDGQDISHVLEGIIDLTQLLTRKLRHAAEKGEPMYRAGQT